MEERKEFKCPKDVPESQIVTTKYLDTENIMSQEEIDNLLTRINSPDN